MFWLFHLLCWFCMASPTVSFLDAPHDQFWNEASELIEAGDEKKALVRVRVVRRRYLNIYRR